MRVYKLKSFARFCRKAGIDDAALLHAVESVAADRFDADLGGGVYKQRIARKGEGKSGGFRTILLIRRGYRLLFVRGFAKKDMDNISISQLADLKLLAETALVMDSRFVDALVDSGEWMEIGHEAEI